MKKILILLIMLCSTTWATTCKIEYRYKTLEFIPPSQDQFLFDGRFGLPLPQPKVLAVEGVEGATAFFGYEGGKSLLFSYISDDVLAVHREVFTIMPGERDKSIMSLAIEIFKDPLCGQTVMIYDNGSVASEQYTTLLYSMPIAGKTSYFILIFSKEEVDEFVTHISLGGYTLEEIESLLSSLTYQYIKAE